MYLETYGLPRRSRNEVVLSEYISSYRSTKLYRLQGSERNYSVGGQLYNNVSIGDTIEVYSSPITNAPQEIGVRRSNLATYKEGYLTFGSGAIFAPITIIGILVILLMLKKMNGAQGKLGKRNLTLAMFVITLLHFFFYLDLNL